jgi:hypothetical protein
VEHEIATHNKDPYPIGGPPLPPLYNDSFSYSARKNSKQLA